MIHGIGSDVGKRSRKGADCGERGGNVERGRDCEGWGMGLGDEGEREIRCLAGAKTF